MKFLKPLAVSIFALLLFGSCQEEATYKEGKFNTAIITPQELKIIDVDVDKWRVGTGFQTEISRGIQIVFNLPILDLYTVNELYEKHKVDGWIIRVTKQTTNRRTILGYLYYPLQHAKRGRLGVITQQIKSGAIRIYYSAASISTRLDKLKCPALGHDKRITSVKIREEPFRGKFMINASENHIIGGKVERFSLRPTVFNGAMSLEGTYFVEVAFFNSKAQEKKSNFVKIAGEAVVEKEESVVIRGCD